MLFFKKGKMCYLLKNGGLFDVQLRPDFEYLHEKLLLNDEK